MSTWSMSVGQATTEKVRQAIVRAKVPVATESDAPYNPWRRRIVAVLPTLVNAR